MYKLEIKQDSSLCPNIQIQLQYIVLMLSNLGHTMES